MIGRATRAFLASLPDGKLVVVKDSWVTLDRPREAVFIQDLAFHSCPVLINSTVLQQTGTFRSLAVHRSNVKEIREKRRTVIYPAGVHVSDSSSLWELMAAFLDIALGM
jgi:hypothetical protein